MTKYRVKIRCKLCYHVYQRTLTSLSDPDPPCPKCGGAAAPAPGIDFETGKAPAVGGSNLTKAVDLTAQIVMEDHKMTDLKDNVRYGETAVPKLPPVQQAMADSMFSRKKPGINPNVLNTLGRRALAGGYAGGTPDVIRAVHNAKLKPGVKIIAGD